MINNKAIAILTFQPDLHQVRFYKEIFAFGYDIFVVVDDNEYLCPGVAGIEFLQVEDKACCNAGYTNLNPPVTDQKPSDASAWEKALFYFSQCSPGYSTVWFIEDDVFIPSAETIPNIDFLYPDADIVSNDNDVNTSGEIESWYWWQFVPRNILPLPWARSMVCAVRLSRALLDEVNSLIKGNIDQMNALSTVDAKGRVFFFIEYLFHTIALQRNMEVVAAKQLSGIVYRRAWNMDEIEKDILYHPFKDKGSHLELRERLIGWRSNSPQLRAEPLTRMDAHMTLLEIRSVTDRRSALPELVRRALEQAVAGETKLTPEILGMPGMSGRCYRGFINNLVGLMPASRYLEVGSWAGSTLCSAVFGNDVQAVAIDNWSEFGGPADQFFRHLAQFKGAARVSFLEKDFRRIDFEGLSRSFGRFGLYLYDGPHAYEDQYDGISAAQPALAMQYVQIVDDWNWDQVRAGTFKAIANLGLQIDFMAEIRTTLDGTYPALDGPASDWHNGYCISVLSRAY